MAQLKITELPTDRYNVLSGVRRALVTTYTNCRNKAERLDLLEATLQKVLATISAEREDMRELQEREEQLVKKNQTAANLAKARAAKTKAK